MCGCIRAPFARLQSQAHQQIFYVLQNATAMITIDSIRL